MDQGYQENPIAEIALALSMGFFAVMVLAVISLGSGRPSLPDEGARILALALRPAADQSPQAATFPLPAQEQLVIYYRGRFRDGALEPIDPQALSARPASPSPMILAIPPDLPLGEAMDARARIERDDLVVTTLNQRWMQVLERDLQ